MKRAKKQLNSSTNSNKLLVFAQEAEALPTIHALQALPVPDEFVMIHSEGVCPASYRFSQGWIILTNMGALAAAQTLSKYLYKYNVDEIINLGFAASLEKEAIMGEIHSVLSVDKHTLLPRNFDPASLRCYEALHPSFSINEKGKRLLTSDYPIHNQILKNKLEKKWDLIDMEGYGIAHTALTFGKKLSIYKIISDFATTGGRDLIRKHKKELAEKLAEKALKETLYASSSPTSS